MYFFKIIARTVGDYLRNSSINGLSHAARAKSKLKRVYWLTLVVIGGILTSLNIFDIIKDFQSYPVTTSIDIKRDSIISFPAVTICNLNRIHCLRTFDELEDLERFRFTYAKHRYMENELTVGRKDYATLKKIMVITGCMEKVCEIFEKYVLETEKVKKNLYISLGIYCNKSSFFDCTTAMAYFDLSKTVDKKRIVKSLLKQECDVQEICMYRRDFEKKEVCQPSTFNYIKSITKPKKPKSIIDQIKKNSKKDVNKAFKKHIFKSDKVDINFRKEDEFNELFFELSSKTREAIGHPLKNIDSLNWSTIKGFMIDCSFKGSSCYHEKFWRVMSIPCCGNCFTFNTIFNDQDNDTLKKVSLTGIMNGLSLELYLNQDNYMQKGLSRKAGATVVIHDGAVLPQIEEFGHQIPPKTATSIALEKKISKLMPHPYETDCINYWSDTKYFNYIVKDIQHIYSLESCQKLCIQIELIDRCNCQHVHLYTSLLNETYITDKDGTPLRTCSSIPSDKNADYKCYMNVQREHDEGVQTCDCKNPCLSVAYRMSVATSDWPSDYYMPIILEKLNESRIISPVDSLLRKRDYVRADVFFESLNVLSVKTNPKYNIDSFFAGLGGALSFYMGIAIIMVFEALELIFDILVTAMKELGQIERKEPK